MVNRDRGDHREGNEFISEKKAGPQFRLTDMAASHFKQTPSYGIGRGGWPWSGGPQGQFRCADLYFQSTGIGIETYYVYAELT